MPATSRAADRYPVGPRGTGKLEEPAQSGGTGSPVFRPQDGRPEALQPGVFNPRDQRKPAARGRQTEPLIPHGSGPGTTAASAPPIRMTTPGPPQDDRGPREPLPALDEQPGLAPAS